MGCPPTICAAACPGSWGTTSSETSRWSVRSDGLRRAQGCTPAQLSLAWLLGQGDDIVPIPGTKRRTYIEENVAAASIRLGVDEMTELDALFAPGAVSGDRYPADMMRLVDKTGS